MIHEHEALELASAALDFELTPAESRTLAEALADCPVCAERAAAYRTQSRRLAELPLLEVSDRTRRRVTAAALSGRAPSRPGLRPQLQLLAAALLLGLILAGVAAVGAMIDRSAPPDLSVADPSASPEPSASASINVVDASAAPANPAPPPDGAFATDTIVVVVSGNLRVRSQPGVESASIKYEPLLQVGDRLFVTDGPVVADDYEWYEVVPIAAAGSRVPAELPSGWIARGDHDGTPWVEAGTADCAADLVDVEVLEEMPQLARVACYGGEPMWLTAIVDRVSGEACTGGPCGEEPWVGGWSARSDSKRLANHFTLEMSIDPASALKSDELGSGTLVAVHGAFDRPDAMGCRDRAPSRFDVLACRGLFVVDDVRPTSVMPVGRVAMTVTDNLRVRSQPFVGEESALLTPLLDDGDRLFVVAGPVLASGYTWYEVIVPAVDTPGGGLQIGWVAAADRNGTPWISTASLTCPPVEGLTVSLLAELTRAPTIDGGLACYGEGTAVDPGALTIRGRVDVECAPPESVDERAWVGLGEKTLIISDGADQIRARPHPDLVMPLSCGVAPNPETMEIEGHFDDPAALECTSDRPPALGPPQFDFRISTYRCRSTFVVSALGVLGP